MKTLTMLDTKVRGRVKPKSERGAPQAQNREAEAANLQLQVAVLANSISDQGVRAVVGKVLADLAFLLNYLSLIEGGLGKMATLREVLTILDSVRAEACLLVGFIENHALQLEGLDQPLYDSLDTSAYAIEHEVGRIFDVELANSRFDQPDQKVLGTLLHAQGVLKNCFQQCLISLAQVFDDSLTGSQLFYEWKIRRENSLILCQDLLALIDLVKNSHRITLECIAEELKTFRDGSMQLLMYKDWEQYESFSEEIIVSIRNGETPTHLLGRFCCYLETLLGQVRARAVLADSGWEPSYIDQELRVS